MTGTEAMEVEDYAAGGNAPDNSGRGRTGGKPVPANDGHIGVEGSIRKAIVKGNADLVNYKMVYMVNPSHRLLILRFPNRRPDQPLWGRYGTKPIELRIKPKCGHVELDVPTDYLMAESDQEASFKYQRALLKSRNIQQGGSYGLAGGFGVNDEPEPYKKSKGQANETATTPETELSDFDSWFKKITFGGIIEPYSDNKPRLMAGTFKGNVLYLSHVDAVVELTVNFQHLDALSDQEKTSARHQRNSDRGKEMESQRQVAQQKAEAKEVNVAVKSTEPEEGMPEGRSKVKAMLQDIADEPWQRMKWIDQDEPESYRIFDEHFGLNGDVEQLPELVSSITPEQWLDSISCPRYDHTLKRYREMTFPKKCKVNHGEKTTYNGDEDGYVDANTLWGKDHNPARDWADVQYSDERENNDDEEYESDESLKEGGKAHGKEDPRDKEMDNGSDTSWDLAAPVEPVINTSVYELPEASEWRFEVAFASKLEVKLLSGTAELFGTELALKQTYTFTGTKAAIYTWHGCRLEIAGDCQVDYLAEETPMSSYANLHFALERQRDHAASSGRDGPRVLILGPEDVGKTSLVKLLTAYATRSGRQPLAVNLDPKEALLSIPGSLSASAFSSIIDVEDGWGSSPTNGPSPIPVKLPLVYYYGQANPDACPQIYKPIVARLALAVLSRLQEDAETKATGCLIDTPGVISQGKGGYEIVQHIVSEFQGSERLYSDMLRRFNGQSTGTDATTTVIKLDRSGGSVNRDDEFLQRHRQAQVREYFFGDAKVALSPHTQQVDFSQFTIYQISESSDMLASLLPGGEAEEEPAHKPIYERTQPSGQMQNGILAVVQADVNDTHENIRDASVVGFIYVAEVDEKRKKLRILTPMGGRIPHRALVWGSWPADVGELVG
ncbi:MAG: hypothetical protein Q9173_002494 [Seirophora scorigena]